MSAQLSLFNFTVVAMTGMLMGSADLRNNLSLITARYFISSDSLEI